MLRLAGRGQADVATASELLVALGSAAHRELAIIATISTSAYQIKLLARRSAGIAEAPQVRGKRIGTVPGSSAQYFLDNWLVYNDIDPGSVTVVGLTPDKIAPALQARDVDAVAIWEPLASSAALAMGGDAVLFASPRVYTQHFNLVAARALLEHRADDVARLLRALLRAQQAIRAEPAAARALLAERLRLPPLLAATAMDNEDYRLRLDQSLVTTMQSQARWATATAAGAHWRHRRRAGDRAGAAAPCRRLRGGAGAMSGGLPIDEARRLAALRDLGVLDTSPEAAFDTITHTAAQLCGVPIALISLIDAQRQWFKSNVGLQDVPETPRDVAFCDHAIRDAALFEVPDATLDARFAANPLVTGKPDIRFYAGAPIMLAGGERIGTVCVIDRAPRELDERQRAMLQGLAAIVGAMLTQRRALLSATSRLAESEQRVRRLYEATPAILHSIGADGRILNVSDRWLALLGYERDEVIGRASSEFLTPASQAHARDTVLPAFFRNGSCDRVPYQFVRRDGSIVDVLLSAVLERDAQGAGARSLSVLEDVTATKALQRELGRTHAHLDAVVDNMPALVGYWDRDTVTRFVNRDFQAAVGLPTDRLIGQPLGEVFAAIDTVGYATLAPRIEAVLAGRRQEFEWAMLTTSGLRQLRVTLVPARPFDDQADGFYGTWFDITGMKALELRQRNSEQRYRQLFDHLASGHALHAIEVDERGTPVDYRFVAMNAAFSAMLGIDAAIAVGARVTDLVPGVADDPADWIGRFGRIALGGEPARFEQQAASGRWWDIVAYCPVPGQFAVIAQDISERKQLQAEVARLRADLPREPG